MYVKEDLEFQGELTTKSNPLTGNHLVGIDLIR